MHITWRVPAAMAVGAIPLIFLPHIWFVWVWFAAVLLLVLFDLIIAPSPGQLAIERLEDPSVRLGEMVDAHVYITNPGKRTYRLAVRDAWQPSAGAVITRSKLTLPGGERRLITTSLIPTRRGHRQADRVTVRSFGLLRLAARQLSFDCPGCVRSLPAFPSRKHLPSRLAMLQQIEGRAVVRNRGQGTEFDSLRDYVEGDDVRAIDWRATARRQHPVVRTWRPERDRRIMLVLDTSRVSAGRVDDTPRLDSAMDAGLFLGALAGKAGDLVGLVAGDREVLATVSPTRNGVLSQLSTAMSRLEPTLVEADWMSLASAVRTHGSRTSLLVLLTPLDPAAVGETLLPMIATLATKHRIVIASVADPELDRLTAKRECAADVHAAAAAERTRGERQRTADALAQLGVTVIDEPPAQLPLALADHYLMLKSRGLL